MKYKIEILRPWKYRHRKRGMQQLPVGEYRVPEDLDEWAGLLAVMQGMARKIEVNHGPAPAPIAQAPVVSPKKPRGRPKKMLVGAPENKAGLA